MFGKIVYISDNMAHVKIDDDKNIATDLMNINVIFEDADHKVMGDIAYGKLRLKGFYDENSKKVNQINNIKNLNQYWTNNCANDCKYFVIKKVK